MQGMDWRLDSAAGCYVSGERLRVVDDGMGLGARLEVYIVRNYIGRIGDDEVEVLRRYRLEAV